MYYILIQSVYVHVPCMTGHKVYLDILVMIKSRTCVYYISEWITIAGIVTNTPSMLYVHSILPPWPPCGRKIHLLPSTHCTAGLCIQSHQLCTYIRIMSPKNHLFKCLWCAWFTTSSKVYRWSNLGFSIRVTGPFGPKICITMAIPAGRV